MIIIQDFDFMRVPTRSKLFTHLNRVAAGGCSRRTGTFASEYGARQCDDGSGNSKEREEREGTEIRGVRATPKPEIDIH